MFNLYERKIEPFNEYSSTAAGSHENIHRAKARTRPYAALIQEVFSQTLSKQQQDLRELMARSESIGNSSWMPPLEVMSRFTGIEIQDGWKAAARHLISMQEKP